MVALRWYGAAMLVHQSIQRPTGITVFGSYVLRVPPDAALITFAVSRLEAEAVKAFASNREAVTAVREYLQGAEVTPADIETSQVRLSIEHEGYGKERVFLGYRAHVGFSLRLVALDRFEEILAGIVTAGVNEITHTEFKTTRLGELRGQARREAFAAARRKAELYAEEAGIGVGDVLHLEDVNPDSLRSRASHGADVDLSGDDAPLQPSAPGSIEVKAAVMVAFAIRRKTSPSGFA